MTECCGSIVEICFTIFSGSGFFTVLLYAPSMAKLRDEEFNFCNKIVILNVTVHSSLYVNTSVRGRLKKVVKLCLSAAALLRGDYRCFGVCGAELRLRQRGGGGEVLRHNSLWYLRSNKSSLN